MSVYIHIPFCKKACHYCNFHFSTTRYQLKAMVNAICSEIELQKSYLPAPVETIYFGGGTPSILDVEDLEKMLSHIYKNYPVAENPEITLETNPDDITEESLRQWCSLGINRLSIGVQSFYEEDLRWMNRAHDAKQASCSIRAAQDAGFSNITIDLIYGTPLLSHEKWEQNIRQAISLGVPHLSCYALTVEPKTALHKFIEKNKTPGIDADRQADQFELLMNMLSTDGYEHYEISNFARPGFRSRHNSNYWSGKPYVGIGPSAHSFNGDSRRWNIANNALYIRSMEQGIIPFEEEMLTPENKMNEYIMTSLRTSEGLDLTYFAARFGTIKQQQIKQKAQKWAPGFLQQTNGRLILSNAGKLMADGIAADLFF